MAKGSPARQAWMAALRPACRQRGLRFVSASGFVLDDVYLTEFVYPQVFHPDKDPDRLRITWSVDVKPLAVDEILWAAFLPEVKMGRQMRINRRVNGAFRVKPTRIHSGRVGIPADEQPDWDPILDQFERARAEFIAAHPTVTDYAAAVERSPEDLVRTITALMAAGRDVDAARTAEDAIARGEQGSMGSTVDVLKYLAAYANGPTAYAEFTASLTPTHDYRVLYESRPSTSTTLCRTHHPGSMRRTLAEMDGSDPWALILDVRPPAGVSADFSNLLYLQAAGTAEAMTVELCRPGGADLGAVSVRCVVGHIGSDERRMDIELPSSTQTVGINEVFTAEEAADLFEAFYRTGDIGDGYTLRPTEAYTADGEPIDL